jgi:hypothetical protein
MATVIEALKKLRPNCEVVVSDNDYSTAVWHNVEGNPPTNAEVNKMIEQLQKEELEAKANAEAKFAALGLTIDDLKALGIG